MNNISQFSSKDEIQQQACAWVSRIDRGLSLAETKALQRWVASSSSHRKMLMQAAQLWDDMSVMNELSGLFPLREAQTQQVSRLHKLVKQARWSIAAGFALMALGVGMIMDWAWFEQQPEATIVMQQTVETAIGEQKNVTLSDGSIIHLNTDTVLAVTYTDSQRLIDLIKGEAHFTVAHDKQRPFSVNAGHNSVTAVGTAFNMQYVENEAFELVVTEGRVLVKQNEHTELQSGVQSLISKKPVTTEGLLMFSGEKAMVQGAVKEKHNVSENDIDEDLAWQQGMIVFKGEPLYKVLQEIGRYTPIQFKLMSEDVKNRRVAGFFKVGDIDGLLFALKNSFQIEYTQELDKVIELRSAG
ncbi:FecR domain-containing protein [Alteromonas ponticola]|uniref:FecR domain-containing protein n=1 Tax=Alteromonas aquimaris TaxID=2998417 RepID=A0ABT3P5D3_9ALTE|nr:FecR domain-containing protein [Alteromonas aquimaris]MCW8107730.1 FecR domain-containing protein [Alteromonas aquimaris]